MKCPNCKSQMKKVGKDYFCEACKELYFLKDDKAVVIENKKKWLEDTQGSITGKLKELAGKLGFELEDEEDGFFPFI